MHRKPRVRGRLFMVWLSAALLFGCAGLPTQPNEMQDTADPVSSAQWVRSGVGPGGSRQIILPAAGTTQLITKDIDGSTGGKVEAGRFEVNVPRGAFNGMGEITITVPDSNVLRVELHITGVANDFAEPVRLVVSWDGMLGSLDLDPNALEMAWFDEDRKTWVIIPSQVDLDAKTIWSDLQHFSEYGVLEGKAGW